MNLRTKQILITNLLVFISILVVSGFSYYALNKAGHENISTMETYMRDQYDKMLKDQVDIVTNELDGIVNQIDAGVITEDEGKLIAADIIRNAVYGENNAGYFWADDLEGNNIVLLGGDSEGTNRLDLQDIDDKYIIQEFISQAKNGGGYVDYKFRRPSGTEPIPKRGYSKLYEPFGWVIGTGNYVDDIDHYIADQRIENEQVITQNMLIIVGVAILMLVLGVVGATLYSISLTRPIRRINDQLKEVSELNFAENANMVQLTKRKDEIGSMAQSVQHLSMELMQVIQEIQRFTRTLNKHVSDMTEISSMTKENSDAVVNAIDEFAQGAQEQAGDAQESVYSLEALNEHIDTSNQLAEEVMAFSEKVKSQQEVGETSVTELVQEFTNTLDVIKKLNSDIDNLNEHSNNINEIIVVIEGIAGQTNLLALNASIEAARAGEAGKGFAVVASEIRSLAEQTTQSTKEINDIIRLVTESVDASKANMDYSNTSIQQAFEKMQDVRETFNETSNLTRQSGAKMKDVKTSFTSINQSKEMALHAIQSISAVTEENAAASEEINASMTTQKEIIGELDAIAKEVSDNTRLLNELMERFKLEHE